MATKPRAHPNEPAVEEEQPVKGFASYADEVEFRKARYSHVEREMDVLGRMIGVRRMKLSERTRLVAMTPDLGGMDEVQRADGSVMLAPQRAQYFIVAMVCQINDSHITFARNRGELDAILDRLDQEGLDAAAIAVNRILADDGESGDQIERAKNLSGIPGSE